MKKIYFWILKKIAEKLVKQGYTHEADIEQYYKIMFQAAYNEFYEESKFSLYGYLSERHKKAHFDII